ncbi:MAG TPA: hypothetical protein VGN42_20280 [Pirellulales bacterium]|jgi:hypothetical protein|nr:hypothetical protein [Pirellulales bacterium]
MIAITTNNSTNVKPRHRSPRTARAPDEHGPGGIGNRPRKIDERWVTAISTPHDFGVRQKPRQEPGDEPANEIEDQRRDWRLRFQA